MNRFSGRITALVSVAVVFACSGPRPIAESSATSPVDQIVQKNIDARGGLDAIRAIESVRMTGTVEAEGFAMPMTIQTKRPGMVRTDVVVESMNMEFITAFDGETAWEINPTLGSRPRTLGPERTRQLAEQADLDGALVDYRSKGHELELVRDTLLDGAMVHEIQMRTSQDATVRTLFVDAETNLVVKIDGEGVNPQTGRSVKTESFLGDYRSFGGVVWPHAIEIRMRGSSAQRVFIDEIETNVPVADSIFAFPE